MTVPGGAGPAPHAHPDFEEVFHALEGQLLFKSETGSFLAHKGATIAIPKGGVIHNFKNNSDKPARLLCTVIPAGLEDFFVEVEELINGKQYSDAELKERMELISTRYGQKVYSPDFWDL